MKKHLLVIEDDPIMRLGMSHFLTYQGYKLTVCADGGEGLDAVARGGFELIITDLKLPLHDGFEILERARAVAPAAGVIIITAYADVKSAVHAIKSGAFDYIAKPFSNEELLITVERFFNFQKLEEEVTILKEALRDKTGFDEIAGESPAMRVVFDRISVVAGTDVPVLILGESGTGKELVANAVHRMSKRSAKPFIKINCAAIPDTLFESELFGYEKGAFTGAAETRKGKLEFADGGSIFFDEIGDIPLSLQPRLLRVLEDGMITRLGGNVPIRVSVRGIYATSKDLREAIASGTFREDLFYRINVVPISIPPLRDRREDIPCLIDYFLKHFKERYDRPELTMSRSAYEALLSFNYVGNVRELKHAVERAVVLSKNSATIECVHLPEEIAGKMISGPCARKNLSLEESVRCFEKHRILTALNETHGKKIDAARKLGISRKVLWKKIKEYRIE
ncbi:MAG: sigma-54-dependent Fis family transcriptional regulator [Deltaproteobacteria bacterium]|nr:sigma-54-dependent Fis family transcriptional regulator [Deltaproteobacteria bacterium]